MARARAGTARHTYDFHGVAALGAPAGPEAAGKLAELYGELTDAGADPAAQRLRAVDGNVRHLPFSAVERLVAPERVLADLDETYRKPVRRLAIWRNQASLLPLLVTWLSLAIATFCYQRQISGDPNLVTQPFMLLWEERFGGQFVPTFSEIALLDFTLIVGIVLLTMQLHRKEAEATGKHDRMAYTLDAAMVLLAVAVERDAARAPASAEEWATAAQRIMTDAIRQTKELSAANQHVVESAAAAVQAAHEDGKNFIRGLAAETTATVSSLQAANQQFIDRTVKEATTVLRNAVAADRALVNDQMAPLVAQFRSSVAEFNKSYGVYQASTSTFVGVVAELGTATRALGDSARSYAGSADSIDRHLQAMERAQAGFVSRVADTAASMEAAAAAMGGVSTLLRDSVQGDLQAITANLSRSTDRLAKVDASVDATTTALAGTTTALAGTTTALGTATTELRKAAADISRAAHPHRWSRPWSRRGSTP